MSRKVVGIDGRALSNVNRDRGIGTYTRHLVSALVGRHSDEFEFVLFACRGGDGTGLDDDVLSAMRVRWLERPRGMYGGALEHLRFARSVDGARPGLFHALDANVSPLITSPTVVTVHDLIPQVLAGAYLGPRTAYWSRTQRSSARRSKAVVAVSRATARDAVRIWKVDPAKITVIYEGVSIAPVAGRGAVDEARRWAGLSPNKDYFLYVGGFDPRKNMLTMLTAYRRFLAGGGRAGLLLAGDATGYSRELEAAIRGLGLEDEARVAGFVPGELLGALYAGCLALLMPSTYEGFGLPVVEAMACGAPVITSSGGSLEEIAGGAAVVVDPLDADGFTRAMTRLESDRVRRMELAALGLERAQAFTWDGSADEVARLYRKVLEREDRHVA